MKVKVVYSWEMGVSDTLVDFNELNNWMMSNRNLRVLSITEESLPKLTEWENQELEEKLREKYEYGYQGRAILNTEEEKDDVDYFKLTFYFIISLAALKYIFDL